MSRAEVTAFSDFGPYLPVETTAGVETRNAILNGRPANVSFGFQNDALSYIQVWRYEGPDFKAAREATLALFDELAGPYGPIAVPARLTGRMAYSCRYKTHYVLLLQDPVGAPDRTVSTNIVIEFPGGPQPLSAEGMRNAITVARAGG